VVLILKAEPLRTLDYSPDITPDQDLSLWVMETDKSPRLSPRQLRRAKTENELEVERSIVKIQRIKSNSEELSRHRNPERKAKQMLKTLQSLPRPRSPSISIEYMAVLENIKIQSPGHDQQIAKLAQRPDLSRAIADAVESNSLEPLLNWPERLWPERAFRRLLIDPETKELRSDCSLFVRLLATWVEDHSTPETYFREDDIGGKRMFIFMVNTLDSWVPQPNQDLFNQCVFHCIRLPYALARLLRRLRRAVPKLASDILLSALLLNCYLPRALTVGCKPQALTLAMRQCLSPPKELSWLLKKALDSLAATKKHNQVQRQSLDN
jgi:hypothetical protein